MRQVIVDWLGQQSQQAHDPVTRGWLVVTAGSVARLAIGFIPSVVIARALGPAELGVYALLGAVAMIVGAVVDLGLTESAVHRIARCWPNMPDLARQRVRCYFWIRIGVASGITGAGILLAGPIASTWRAIGYDGELLSLALIGVAATALSGAVSGILQATGHFGRLSLAMMTNAILTACLAIALWSTGQLTLVSALLILGVATSIASFAVGRRLLPQTLDLALPSRGPLKAEARELFSFGVWIWVANTLAVLMARFDLLLAGHWLAPATVGSYALALTLATKVEVVNQSLHTVLLPTASSLKGRQSLRRYLRRGLIRSSLIAVALLPLIPLAHPLITFFFGTSFELSAGLFPALLGVAIVDVFAAPVLLLAYPANRPQLIAAAHGLRGVIVFAFAAWLLPIYGPYGLVLAKLAASLAAFALTGFVLAHARDRS